MGEAGRRRVEQEFTWEVIVERTRRFAPQSKEKTEDDTANWDSAHSAGESASQSGERGLDRISGPKARTTCTVHYRVSSLASQHRWEDSDLSHPPASCPAP